MQFKVDENLPVEIVEVLQTGGHDALTVLQQQLGGQADVTIADVCQREGRVLVTLDLDFADIRSYPPEKFAGLIVFRPSTQHKSHLLELTKRILPLIDVEPLAEHLWIIEDASVRIRGRSQLP